MYARFAPLALLSLLIACGTPQERCIAGATKDLRVLDRLIGETQTNLQRGYALEEVVRTSVRWEVCQPAVAATATSPAQPAQMCLEDYDYTVTRPKAINLADEREKLGEMQKKRRDLATRADSSIAQCRLQYPE